MQRALCTDACLKMFASLLKTNLLSSPAVVLIVQTSIFKAFGLPFSVVFGFKNSNIAMVSRPYVWLETPEGHVTDIGITARTDKISICGTTIGFVPTATDVTYTSDVSGPIYKVSDDSGTLDTLRKIVNSVQQDGVETFVKKLEASQQAAIQAALQFANDPSSRITFDGIPATLL